MVLSLDPRYPVVWRTPDSLQFGVDRALVTLTGVTAADERVIAALRLGLHRASLDYLAGAVGVPRAEVDRLIDVLAPAIVETARPPEPMSDRSVLVDGTGPTADRVRTFLDGVGIRPFDQAARQTPALVVLVASHVVPPRRYGRWLRRDVPHVPIVFGDTGVRIGPLVEPGLGPCLYCLELQRTDADPAWPAIASQLLDSTAAAETQRTSLAAASRATELVLERLTTTRRSLTEASVFLDAESGETMILEHRPHEECGCRSPTGNANDPFDPGVASRSQPNSA
ncbi:hypothetical protein [Luethyella okanaganae]|uniref:Bacteriocin biosynthesis cyclodehydratase domain-containing protein n=1 Tax=Luethyella okanaganae TaxID=69372 RepID=A0ABW1VDE9_9MICO